MRRTKPKGTRTKKGTNGKDDGPRYRKSIDRINVHGPLRNRTRARAIGLWAHKPAPLLFKPLDPLSQLGDLMGQAQLQIGHVRGDRADRRCANRGLE